MDDISIIELLQKRNESAISEIRSKYMKLCEYIAGNVLSMHEDVEECVNSACYEVWNNIPPANPKDLKSYICRIVRNIAINRLEYNSAAKRDSRYTVSLEEISDCVPANPDNDVILSDLADAISRFLHSQDELHRRVFVLRTCPHRVNVRIIRHNFVGDKAKNPPTGCRPSRIQGFLRQHRTKTA